jgi:hypothetical protein
VRALVLLTLCATLTGCSSPTAPTVPFNRDFTLAPGDEVTVDTGSRIRFVDVRNDSRCPADAVCILGGDAIVRIAVTSKGAHTERYELHTGSLQAVSHGGFVIRLVSLTPHPFSSTPTRPGEYRLTLRVTG